MIARISAVASQDFSDIKLSDDLENKLRRADLFTRGIIACCHDLLQGQVIDGDTTGIFISSAYGPMQCNLDVLDFLVEEEPVSPTLFSHSVFNGASGYVARIFNIHGPAMTQTSYSYPFFTALAQAKLAIEQEDLKHAVVVQAETYSQLLEDAKGGQSTPWPTGVVAWLLGGDGIALQSIQVAETPCTAEDRLRYSVTCSTDNLHNHPLSMGMELSHLFSAKELPETYDLISEFGKVHLKFGDKT